MKEKNIIQKAHLFTHIYEPDEIAKEYQKSLKQVLKLYKKLKHDNDLMQAEFERLENLEDDRDILKYQLENSISKDKIKYYYKKICASVNHFQSKNDNNIVLRIKEYLEELLEE